MRQEEREEENLEKPLAIDVRSGEVRAWVSTDFLGSDANSSRSSVEEV